VYLTPGVGAMDLQTPLVYEASPQILDESLSIVLAIKNAMIFKDD
jgi:hypothetical protein